MIVRLFKVVGIIIALLNVTKIRMEELDSYSNKQTIFNLESP